MHNCLNSFVKNLLLNWLWELAPMCLRHHLLFKLGHCADLWRSTLPFCMSSMACRIPLCRSYITQTLGTSVTTICFSLSKNQYQLSPDSFSTKAMARGTSWLLPVAAIAVRIVPLYFPVRNVPSMHMTGRQCRKASMQAPKAKKERCNTGLPGFWTQGYVFKS